MENFIGFKLLEPNNIIDELVIYIESELKSFTGSEEFINILELKKNENQHSLSFCVFMTNNCSSKFYFARENSQLGTSVIDIGVYYGSSLIFTIEAKLLPTPNSGPKEKRLEHEYVFGKGAGIQRFKEGKHGLNNRNEPLSVNGLIGFIKADDYKFWLTKINGWIGDAGWEKSEHLQLVNGSNNRLESFHTRDDKSNLTLHHFWVQLT
ncbi:hypothetical protein GCM10022289_21590 [Pedobacter jeongneungensis]|uniref:Uncharacterized protein n=1 Tax=Pedobacter jeongneungensis TaxID=947309 RepID=A0ABP8BDJ1_9SPHI